MDNTVFLTDQNFQKFIDKLDIGIDGTYFAPFDTYTDKAFKQTHFGLSILLSFAFDLLTKEEKEHKEEFLQISFNDFYDYVENAKNILTNMQYIEGDRLVANKYEIKVYENPKNYSVVELDSLLPITEEQLQRSYIVPGIHITEDGFISQRALRNYKKVEKKLTPREAEAFYGDNAKKILGILPKNQKTKQISKKILQNK